MRLCYRVKQLREEPYSQEEAEAAIGLQTDNKGPDRPPQEILDDTEMTT